MNRSQRAYRGSVRALSVIFVLVGAALLASTLARGGGPLALGTLLGIAFIAVGLLRLRVARAMDAAGDGGEGGGRDA